MGVPTQEVGYTSATTGREDQEVHKGHVVALEGGGEVTNEHTVTMITLKEFVTEAETLAATNLTILLLRTSSNVQLSKCYCVSTDDSASGFWLKNTELGIPRFFI
jgi:hypothetical protein